MNSLFFRLKAFFIPLFVRTLLSLRYRIEIRGLEHLTPERLNRKGGIIFLPNHPAHMDPLIIFSRFWPKFRMRSIATEYIFRTAAVKPIAKLTRAISVPGFEIVNQYKVKKAEQTLNQVAEGLKNGENFGFYPAGKTKSSAKELLGGASGCHAILEKCPEANVVLIRTTGLWGSSFSRSLTGKSAKLNVAFAKSAKSLLKNLIFFTPRRRILIEVEPNPQGLPRQGTRLELNRFLENWYNRYPDGKGNLLDTEPLKLVSYSAWSQDLAQINLSKKNEVLGSSPVSEKTKEKVYAEFRAILKDQNLKIKPESNLAFDLGMDSINLADIFGFLNKNYGVADITREDVNTVQDILNLAEGAKVAREEGAEKCTHTFPKENRDKSVSIEGNRVAEAFLNTAERLGDLSACGDDAAGVLSYNRIKLSAIALSKVLKKIPEKNVAVMLPASCGAMVVVLALHMADKVPVMLNWTLGPRYLEEMMKLSEAKTILSSWKFLDRLPHVDFGNLVDHIRLLEDLREEITFTMKIQAKLLSRKSPKKILKALEIENQDEESPAVILFTSGTEAVPKAVPLTHKNVLSNQKDTLDRIDLNGHTIFYCVLPPFHSFGFTVIGLLPIMAGMRVTFFPNPSNYFAIAEGIERWRATLYSATPTFLKGLFSVAKPEQLKSVEIFVAGAEKAPRELFDRAIEINPKAQLIEGYGTTECAPVIAATPIGSPPKGVGKVLRNFEVCTIHPETHELLAHGATGEICVRGPCVFKGYLGNVKSPFIEINGKKWYRTGDLGNIDQDGFLILSGRLKRFAKIGGEMISLMAIEEVLTKVFIQKKTISPDVPSIAVCGEESLTLYTVIDLEKDAVNQILREEGFSNLIKISTITSVNEIPFLATGKVDYRKLTAV